MLTSLRSQPRFTTIITTLHVSEQPTIECGKKVTGDEARVHVCVCTMCVFCVRSVCVCRLVVCWCRQIQSQFKTVKNVLRWLALMVNNICFSGKLDDNKHAIPANTTMNSLHCRFK